MKPTASYPINATTISYRKTQYYNTVIWLTIQLTGLKKKIFFLADGLRSVNPKTPKFYISPKIHKENNPGKPVINLINCHTSEISRFVNHHRQHLVRKIPSHIKDTNDFIKKIDNFPVLPN